MMVAERMMGGMSLKSLLQGIASVQPNDDREVTGVTLDSRQIVPGTLFVACAGEHHHGLAFAEQALSQGAEAIVWEADGEQGQRLAA
ncbi:MAG: Mur ligase domain-containing protein, partial [Candidatus Thiodiazotropha sp.]